MKVRELSFQLLQKICLERSYSNLLLRHELDRLEGKDKGLATQIIYGTLQNYRLCRYEWEHYAKKLPPEPVCILMDMSVYQLLHMDKIPAYAIINEAVDICKKRINPSYAKLVNALLHQVDTHREIEMKGTKEEILAIQTSHPTWLVNMWSAQYGFETAENICHSDMEIKPMAVRVNRLKTNKEQLLVEEGFEQGRISPDALRYHGVNLVTTSYYKEGLVSIQDEASQLVALCLDPQPNERILDACSAPGTKACHIGELMQDSGEIICGDIHEHRVELIKEGAKRLGLTSVHAIHMDATELAGLEEESFDRVLCDVPCSGYGVLANKSDIKYHMQSSDMDTLIPLQQKILQRCASMVKPKGILVYSTCTLNKKENEKQIQTFLKNHEQFTLVHEETIFPFTYESDGFFMAKLRKEN